MAIFGSNLKEKVLQFFFDHPGQAFYVKELSSQLNVDLGNLSRLLKNLERSEMLIAKRQGKYLTYKLNSNNILLDQIAQLQRSRISLPLNTRTLIHGEQITAKGLEIITSSWAATKFANFCNAIISEVFSSQTLRSNFVSLTERVNVRDSGIDAECHVTWDHQAESLLRPGINVFQFKLRDVASQRDKTLSKLKHDLKEEVKEIGKTISNYILFINMDLTAAERSVLTRSIIEGFGVNAPNIVVCGATELAADCNRFHRIRSSYFVPAEFSTWQEALQKEKNHAFWPWVEYLGRQDDIERIIQHINNPETKVLYILGPQGIGKTRMVLEATAPFRDQVVFVQDRNRFNPRDILLLESQADTILVADDPEPDELEEAVKEVCHRKNLKLIVMFPTPTEITRPGFGFDIRSAIFPVRPFTSEESDKLIRQINKNISYDLLSWIKYHANGNPGVLLTAARVSGELRELRERPENFIEELGSHYERRINKVLGAEALNVLRLISISTFVGISGPYKNEVESIVKIFGAATSLNNVFIQLDSLQKAGLINRTGSFVEVSIPLLATYLAQQLFKGRESEVIQLFVELSGSARLRFLKRMARLNARTITEFWDQIFSKQGLFSDTDSMRTHVEILRVISAAVPERVIDLLETKIGSLTLEQRKAISGDFRSDLRWSLEQLLMRQTSSLKALELIGLLAEAENETWANNCTGIFREAFYPLHPQVPLKLDDRLTILNKFVAENSPTEKRLLAIRAMKDAFTRHFSFSVRESQGLLPYEGRPPLTYGDVWEYFETITDLLFKLADDKDTQIAKAAAAALPHAVSESMIQGRSDKELQKMKKLHLLAAKGEKFDITDYAEALNHTIRSFKEMIPNAKEPNKLQEVLDELIKMRDGFTDLSFESQVRRWAGRWTRDCSDERENGQSRYQVELNQLAAQTVKEPELLSESLLKWLQSGAEKGGTYFHYLGKNDSERRFVAKFDELAKSKEWARVYGAYCSGLFSHSEAFLRDHADKLYSDKTIDPNSLFELISLFRGSKETVEKICQLLDEGALSGDLVASTVVLGRWIEPLDEVDFSRLLKAIAGITFENDYSALNILSMWRHLNKPISGPVLEIAWQCLEAARPLNNRQKIWEYDQVAEVVVKHDITRGLKLARKLIENHKSGCWDPIDRYSGGKFWEILSESKPKECLELLLSLALSDVSMQFHITWNLTEIIDQVRDANVILDLCKGNTKNTEILTRSLTTAKPGFWPIALKLIEWYGDDKRISANLMGGIERLGHMHTGGYHLRLKECVEDIETVLKNEKLSSKAQLWLSKALELFRAAAEKAQLEEENEDINR